MWKQRFLQTFAMMSLISLQTMAAGFLQIDGVVSDAAIVGKAKAVRCNIQLYSSGAGIKKNGCDFKNSYILDLNQSYALPEGLYLVGYENTLYPGIIEIRENQNTKLQLNEVSIGAEFAGKQVKMYRDFAHPIEQKKMMLTHYGLGRSFFLMTENEGEYQLRIPFFKEILAHIDYRGCEIVNKRAVGENTFRIERSDSIRICKSMSSANTFLDYREVFDFSEDGTITEMWVNPVGDLYKFKHKKHMVSQSLRAGDVVYLFSGAYKISTDTKSSISVIVGDIENTSFGVEMLPQFQDLAEQNVENFSMSLDPTLDEEKPPGVCGAKTTLWKTENRAYCRSDLQAGCSRSAAKMCTDMKTQNIIERD